MVLLSAAVVQAGYYKKVKKGRSSIWHEGVEYPQLFKLSSNSYVTPLTVVLRYTCTCTSCYVVMFHVSLTCLDVMKVEVFVEHRQRRKIMFKDGYKMMQQSDALVLRFHITQLQQQQQQK